MSDYPAWRRVAGYEDLPEDYCPHIRSIYECGSCRVEAAATHFSWAFKRSGALVPFERMAEGILRLQRRLRIRTPGGTDDHTG